MAIHQRSDVCAVPAAGVVAEAMVALVVADAVTEKFGGDSVPEVRRNVRAYLDTLADTLPIGADGLGQNDPSVLPTVQAR